MLGNGIGAEPPPRVNDRGFVLCEDYAMKMPAFQFYPADWRKDPGVQALDYFTRGVWFEMLCLMHESSERGVLLLNGKPIPEYALAQLIHLDNQTLTKTITKLIDLGIASRRDTDGAIMNRRMVRDEQLCQLRRDIGKQGGRPVSDKQNKRKQEPNDNQNNNQNDNQNITPSSSSSSSTTVLDVVTAKPKRTPRKLEADQEWIESLQGNPAYEWIAIAEEHGKMVAWLSANPGRKMTRSFVINWLNRIKKPENHGKILVDGVWMTEEELDIKAAADRAHFEWQCQQSRQDAEARKEREDANDQS